LACWTAGAFTSRRAGDYFLKHARVALNDGKIYGKEGEGFVRLNFGCPRSMLMEALERMKNAISNL
jgi:cystathionine beta-lyase